MIKKILEWIFKPIANLLFRVIRTIASNMIVQYIIPFFAVIMEKLVVAFLITPLFLSNVVMDAIDIFAGVSPLYAINGSQVEAMYDETPKVLFINDPEFLTGTERSVMMQLLSNPKPLIQENGSIVLRANLQYSNTKRYMPNVSAFLTFNGIPLDSDKMYDILARAILFAIPIGAGVSAAKVPPLPGQGSQYASWFLPAAPEATAIRNTALMPKYLIRPYYRYTDDNYIMVETNSVKGSFKPDLRYNDESIEIKDNSAAPASPRTVFKDTRTIDKQKYLLVEATRSYSGSYQYVKNTSTDKDGKTTVEYGTVYVWWFYYTYLLETCYTAYKTLYGYVSASARSSSAFESALANMRNNPGEYNNAWIDNIHGGIIFDAETVREIRDKGEYKWVNQFMAFADFVTVGADRSLFNSTPSGATWSYNVSLSNDILDKIADMTEKEIDKWDGDTGALVISQFVSTKSLWRDYLENNADLVYNPRLSRSDWNRYTPGIRSYLASAGVSAAGSEEMYKTLANAIFDEKLQVSDVPVNLWLPPDYYDNFSPQKFPEGSSYVSGEYEAAEKTTLFGYIFENPIISTVFWGITVISMALCLGFSIYAVVRSMGDLQLEKPLGKVLGLAGKSMLTFLIIPLFCLASVTLSGAVLSQASQLIDTAGVQSTSVEGSLFYAAVVPEAVLLGGEKTTAEMLYVDGNGYIKLHERPATSDAARNAQYETLKQAYTTGRRGVGFEDIDRIIKDFDVLKLFWPGNLLLISIAAWFFVVLLVLITFVFIRRLFEIVMLYIIAPLFVATIPLDDGRSFKRWRERFIGAVVMGFGPLIMLKLFILLLPLIWAQGLKLHEETTLNYFLKALMMLGGMFAVYKSHTLIASIVSPSMAESEGAAFLAAAAVVAAPVNYAKKEIKQEINDRIGQIGMSSGGGGGMPSNKQ